MNISNEIARLRHNLGTTAKVVFACWFVFSGLEVVGSYEQISSMVEAFRTAVPYIVGSAAVGVAVVLLTLAHTLGRVGGLIESDESEE